MTRDQVKAFYAEDGRRARVLKEKMDSGEVSDVELAELLLYQRDLFDRVVKIDREELLYLLSL